MDPDQGDNGTGPMLGVSWGVTDFVHVVGSYEDVDFDPAEMTVLQVGAGVQDAPGQPRIQGAEAYPDFLAEQFVAYASEPVGITLQVVEKLRKEQ